MEEMLSLSNSLEELFNDLSDLIKPIVDDFDDLIKDFDCDEDTILFLRTIFCLSLCIGIFNFAWYDDELKPLLLEAFRAKAIVF